MKRRVLNAAANKKAIRQCSAATGTRAPYRVLCDASFLRVAFDYFRHYRKAGENLSKRELEATLPSLETLFAEMFGTQQYFLQATLESHDEFQATYQTSHSNTGAKKFQQQKELEEKMMLGKDAAAEKDAAQQHKKPQHAPHPKLVADAQQFLRKFELVGEGVYDESGKSKLTIGFEEEPQKSKTKRNEHKALIATLNDIAAGKPVNGHAHPIASYFVATLNHDVKAALRRGAVASGAIPIPTIRMTFNPWLLWMDAGVLDNGVAKAAPTAASATADEVAEQPKFNNVSSRADRAFLQHLAKESKTFAATVDARDKFMNSTFGKKRPPQSAQQQCRGGSAPAKKKQSGGAAPVVKANPLSKKAKRQRETIVVGDDAVPAKQHRTENK